MKKDMEIKEPNSMTVSMEKVTREVSAERLDEGIFDTCIGD